VSAATGARGRGKVRRLLLAASLFLAVAGSASFAGPSRAYMEEGDPAPRRAGARRDYTRPRPAPAKEATSAMRPDFDALTAAAAEQTIADRRWIHQHPELSLREFQTQAYIRGKLAEIPGIELIPGEWGTGLVVVLRGGKPGPLVGFRADIDALPIREETGLPFASCVVDSLRGREVGVMHACGHDVHASVLLGIARVLSPVRKDLPGSILFLVEPAEEVGDGAETLIKGGALTVAGVPAAIYAYHVNSRQPYGELGWCPEYASANVDEFRVKVLGRGGHGAYPHRTIDPVVIASQMVLALQTIRSREVDTAERAVITVGSIRGGEVSNVIPDEVELRATVRSLDPQVREQIRDAVLRTLKGIAAAAGAPEPEIHYGYGTPSVYNDPDLVMRTLPTLQRILGEDNVVEYDPGMGGEDFSFFGKERPSFMIRLGVGRPDRDMMIHSSTFDPDERAIPLGVRAMSEVLWDRVEAGE
jgi:amidohydrolase